jgi:hypothetical protein
LGDLLKGFYEGLKKNGRQRRRPGGHLAPSPIPTPQRRKLVEIANGVEAVQDGRIFIERVNEPVLAAAVGGSADQFSAGIERAKALGWLRRHESGTYLKFTDSGAALF